MLLMGAAPHHTPSRPTAAAVAFVHMLAVVAEAALAGALEGEARAASLGFTGPGTTAAATATTTTAANAVAISASWLLLVHAALPVPLAALPVAAAAHAALLVPLAALPVAAAVHAALLVPLAAVLVPLSRALPSSRVGAVLRPMGGRTGVAAAVCVTAVGIPAPVAESARAGALKVATDVGAPPSTVASSTTPLVAATTTTATTAAATGGWVLALRVFLEGPCHEALRFLAPNRRRQRALDVLVDVQRWSVGPEPAHGKVHFTRPCIPAALQHS